MQNSNMQEVLIIPATASRIKCGQFINNKTIKYVVFEPRDNNIPLIIEYRAFFGCDIRSITIPACVTIISWSAFEENINLTSVEFEPRYNNLTLEIDARAFKECNILKLSIPPFVTKIICSTFEKNMHLTSLEFEPRDQIDNPLIIGSYAFEMCDIRSIVIPKFIRYYLGACSFRYNKNLTSVEFEHRDQNDTNLRIGSSAFEGCNIKKLIIPTFVNNIDSQAFRYNVNLANIICLPRVNNAPIISNRDADYDFMINYDASKYHLILHDDAFESASLVGSAPARVLIPYQISDWAKKYAFDNRIVFMLQNSAEHNKERRIQMIKYLYKIQQRSKKNNIQRLIIASATTRKDFAMHICAFI